MSPPRLIIRYGYYPRHTTWAVSSSHRNRVLHIVAYTESGAAVETATVCGIRHRGTREFATGELCPRCAEVMNIRTLDDLDRDEEEVAWMEAQK